MTTADYIVGDCIAEMRAMPADSVDLIVTSPPFLGLRNYLAADDPLKAYEHGMTASPHEFVSELLDMVEACAHVLAPHGSLVIELGDTYSGSGGAGGDYGDGGMRAGQPKMPGSAQLARRRRAEDEWPDPKSLALIPEMLRLAMAYGEQPYTGRRTDRWLIRNVIAWCKPNPSIGDEGDKFRRGWNSMLVATKSPNRWFDKLSARGKSKSNPADTSPLLDWWEVNTGQFKGAHFATFPTQLVTPLVQSLCPIEVCRSCGEPRRRIVRKSDEYAAAYGTGDMFARNEPNDRGTGRNGAPTHKAGLTSAVYEHVGWTDCDCDTPTLRPGIVLDPYAGTGTTLAAATGCGRNAIGIDLDHRNADLAIERIGSMFVTITEGTNTHAQ